MTPTDASRAAIRSYRLAREPEMVDALIAGTGLDPALRARITQKATALVERVRRGSRPSMMEAFLAEYGLSTREGVALMCLAEAMLRVPDAQTIDDLILDKIAPHDWGAHLGDSGSIMVNASTWALMLTGRVLDGAEQPGVTAALRGAVRRLGEPVIRVAVGRAMRELGAQFVLGRDIAEALAKAARLEARGYRYSYDMLGEAARTHADAERYLSAYQRAIAALADRAQPGHLHENPGISVKLSALHPRFETLQRTRTLPVLVPRVLDLAKRARGAGITFNIDAEEAERLELTLDVVEQVIGDPALQGWDGFGVAIQAYAPTALPVIDWLLALAEHLDRRLTVRLVKGAYWDAEIKRAQVLGLDGFPVFTRKVHSDVNYLACAERLLARRDRVYPQFATHNAHTAAAVLELCGNDRSGFELQRLHGMGEALHEVLVTEERLPCRIYAPVGAHEDLLAYLVRRLLENGANSSFVHQIVDEAVAPEVIAKDPLAVVAEQGAEPHPAILAPRALYGAARRNARGFDLNAPEVLDDIAAGRAPFAAGHRWRAAPVLADGTAAGGTTAVRNPANPNDVVGEVVATPVDAVGAAIAAAVRAQRDWDARPVAARADCLRRAADLYEAHAPELLALCTREAGKTLADAVAELREAVDFLRYYAAEAANLPAGTTARGAVVCISPWNFPLAIFTGQVAAAVAAGNAVLAKPAEQTPLIAARATAFLHEAGVPVAVLQLLPGDGATVGAALVADPRLGGVAFTGSVATAQAIDRQLAASAPAAMLIAETGGLNAMVVDSTALPEQAVRDIIQSAFQSAGQRCSALRMLYVQVDVAPRLLAMLEGAMATLRIGDPWELATDVGPAIDLDAKRRIDAYVDEAAAAGRVRARLDVPEAGLFVAPTVIEVGGIADLAEEIFGPVLHVATFVAEELDEVVAAVNASGYGLTFALQTRIDGRVQRIVDQVRAGNLYVNRNQIGAIVGVQPFGGEGLSGTGPKAGGPHYLPRFRAQPERHPAAGSAPRVAEPALAHAIAAARSRSGAPIASLRRALGGRAAAALDAVAALDLGAIDLPGPTGEANRLRLEPRGVALCLGPDAATALDQAVQALGVGGRAVLVAPGAVAAAALLIEAGLPVVALDGSVDPTMLTGLDVDVVAWAGEPGAVRRALAARDGARLRLVDARFDPVAYCHERAVCIDTTAAGGNATLLAQAAA